MRVVAQGLPPETTTLDKVLTLSTPLLLSNGFVVSVILFLTTYGGIVLWLWNINSLRVCHV
jgi:hypothetical protein